MRFGEGGFCVAAPDTVQQQAAQRRHHPVRGKILLLDQHRGARLGETAGVEKLMIIGGRRERDQERRQLKCGELRERGGAGPADHRVC